MISSRLNAIKIHAVNGGRDVVPGRIVHCVRNAIDSKNLFRTSIPRPFNNSATRLTPNIQRSTVRHHNYFIRSFTEIVRDNADSGRKLKRSKEKRYMDVRKEELTRDFKEQLEKADFVLRNPHMHPAEKKRVIVKLLHLYVRSFDDEKVKHDVTPMSVVLWIEDLIAKSAFPAGFPAYKYLLNAVANVPQKDKRPARLGMQTIYDCAIFAESILQRILSLEYIGEGGSNAADETGGEESLNDFGFVGVFHQVMHLYCRGGNVLEAERLLKELERLHDEEKKSITDEQEYRYCPTLKSYIMMITAYSIRGAPTDAEFWLKRLLSRNIVPSKDCFERVLDAWIKAPLPHAGQRAVVLLLKMQEVYEANQDAEDLRPCVRMFSKVLKACVVSGGHGSAERAEAILKMMHEMDWEFDREIMFQSYLETIKAWCQSETPDAPERCELLLTDLAVKIGYPYVPVEIIQKMYVELITWWAYSGRVDLSDKVTLIWNNLQLRRQGDGDLKNVNHWSLSLYHALLFAYSEAGDAEKAEYILRQMLQNFLDNRTEGAAKPDNKTYHTVIQACSNSSDPLSWQRAEDVLQQMLDLGKKDEFDDLKPDVIIINIVLALMAGTDSVETARRGSNYFQELRTLYNDSNGSRNFQPTQQTYENAIRLWSNVRDPEAVDRVKLLIDEMNSLDTQCAAADILTYKAYLAIIEKSSLPENEKSRRIDEAKELIRREGHGEFTLAGIEF